MVEFAGLVIDTKDRNQARLDFVNFGAYFGNALQNQKSLSFEVADTADGCNEELVLSLSYNLSSYSADGKIKVRLQTDNARPNVPVFFFINFWLSIPHTLFQLDLIQDNLNTAIYDMMKSISNSCEVSFCFAQVLSVRNKVYQTLKLSKYVCRIMADDTLFAVHSFDNSSFPVLFRRHKILLDQRFFRKNFLFLWEKLLWNQKGNFQRNFHRHVSRTFGTSSCDLLNCTP